MELFKIIKLEFNFFVNRKEFLYVFTVSLLLMIVAFFVDLYNLFQEDIMNIPPANQLWVGFDSRIGDLFYMFLLPLLASLAYADTYYLNNRLGVYKYILTRCHKKNYVLAKGIVVAFSGFIVIFVPLLINQLLYFIIAPLNSSKNILGWPAYMFIETKNMIFANLFLNSPYLYNILYMVLAGIVGSLAALTSYAISFITNKSRLIIVATPLVIYLVSSFVSALLGRANYCLVYYLQGFTTISGLNATYFFVVLIMSFILSISIIIFKNMIAKDELY
ncbi:MAG: hypothetical protein H0Z35_13605 [Thermoanaerobacteraceae bacterium]|nr:hypothetical protein [Thermoanaerobacteraceae bacterium]